LPLSAVFWFHEKIISLPDLNDIAEKVIGDLEGIEGYLDFMKENEEEYYTNVDEP